jgi:hypothetical protein
VKHNYVPDGCFLLARQIFESAIWRDDPHVLKLFIYLMGQARHNTKPKKYPSFEIKRGELVTSLAKISEENEYCQNGTVKTWARMKISRMLDLLEKQGYIKKLCDTYGTHVSICNYDVYQNINNYKCDTVVTQVGISCDTSGKQVGTNKKGNKGKNGKNENPLWILPEGIKPEVWEEFEAHRKSIKKSLTDTARTKNANVLLSSLGDQQKIVDATIANRWTGLFPLKKGKVFKSRSEKNAEAKEAFLNSVSNEKDITLTLEAIE